MAGDMEHGDKTEQPSDRRRQEIRERGNVAKSVDLNAAASVLATTAVFYFVGEDLAIGMLNVMKSSLSVTTSGEFELADFMRRAWELSYGAGEALAPALGLLVVSAIAVNLMQVGFLLTTEPLQPNFGRLNPISGFQRILSLQGAVRLTGSLLKLGVLVSIVVGFLWARMPSVLGAMELETLGLARLMGSWLTTLAFQLGIGLVSLALLDYGFQFWKFEQEIKMTKQEVRDEMKQMEGDPHIRQRRREAHRKLANARQVMQAKTADAIITNPTEIAVAIKYDASKMDAPIVVAKGKDFLAARIRQIAAEHRIPIIEKKPLAQALYKTVKVGQAIPVELYEAVAEILAYVYRLSNRKFNPKGAA
jgi:flagellar biosynthesis protein FlhB